MTERKEKCEDCCFWETNSNPMQHLGTCKASAPAAGVSGPARWATTQKDEWCGEFKKNIAATERERRGEPSPGFERNGFNTLERRQHDEIKPYK